MLEFKPVKKECGASWTLGRVERLTKKSSSQSRSRRIQVTLDASFLTCSFVPTWNAM